MKRNKNKVRRKKSEDELRGGVNLIGDRVSGKLTNKKIVSVRVRMKLVGTRFLD